MRTIAPFLQVAALRRPLTDEEDHEGRSRAVKLLSQARHNSPHEMPLLSF
jgi:hypothetical protein